MIRDARQHGGGWPALSRFPAIVWVAGSPLLAQLPEGERLVRRFEAIAVSILFGLKAAEWNIGTAD